MTTRIRTHRKTIIAPKGALLNREEGVFTVQELANYLRMKPLTIYKHASGGKLPGFKVGSHWRFKRTTIDQWIQSQEITNSNKKTLINT
jgi:excisionase family DNA binding protein